MNNHTSGIYQIQSKSSGNSYIGSSRCIKKRWHIHRCDLRKGRHHSMLLQRAWNKYGKDGFDFIVLEFVDDLLLLAEREQYWIDQIGPKYNGSLTVYRHALGKTMGPLSEETKEKIRQAVTGFKHTDEAKAKMSTKGKRLNLSEERRESLRLQGRENIKYVQTPEARAKNALASKIRTITPESIKKRAEALQGKLWSDARRLAQVTTRYPSSRKSPAPETIKKGEQRVNSKLTNRQVIEIRQLYIPWRFGTYKLAKLYNVSPETIWQIISNKSYKIV